MGNDERSTPDDPEIGEVVVRGRWFTIGAHPPLAAALRAEWISRDELQRIADGTVCPDDLSPTARHLNAAFCAWLRPLLEQAMGNEEAR
jgi:hypothetical protein